MKPHRNIDDFYKDNLSHSEIPMSGVEDLWHKVDPNKKRRKSPILLWFALSFVVLILAGGFIFYLQVKESNLLEDQQYDTIIADKKQQVKKTTEPTSKVVQQVDEYPNQRTTVIPNNSIVKENFERITQNNFSNSNIQQADQGLIISPPFTLDSQSKNDNGSHSDSGIYFETSNLNEEDVIIFEDDKGGQIESLALLMVKSDHKLNYSRQSPQLSDLLVSTIEKRIKPARLQKLWFGQISATASLVSNKISIEGMDPSSLAEEWKQAVGPIASFQFSFALGRKINAKSSIDIGLEYQYVDNQYIRDTMILKSETKYNPEAYITSAGFRGDSVLVEITTKGIIMKPLRQTLISIPVRYGYNIVRIGHFGVDAGLGLVINLSRQQSGPVLNSNSEWVNVRRRSQNRIGFSYDLSLSATYALNINQTLFVAPRFRYSPTDHEEDLPFNLSRLYGGIALGYRVVF